MSGGHFNHSEACLEYIAEQIENDIKYNDVSWEQPVSEDGSEHYGYQLKDETMSLMSNVVEQLRDLKYILRQYDLAIEGDTTEEIFLKRVAIGKN